MANIEKYLKNKGIEYHKEAAGSRYLPGVEPVIFPAYFVSFVYPDDPTDCQNTVSKIERLTTYCKRYNFAIYSRYGWPGETTFRIASAADLEKYADYAQFEKRSIDAVEKYIHIQKTFNLPVCNEYIAGIMEFYAREYKSFLAAVNN